MSNLDLIDFGTGAMSSTAGAIVDTFAPGTGGLVASGTQVVLKKVVKMAIRDQKHRKLSTLEEIRTGMVLWHFTTKLEQNVSQGRTLRLDGFLSKDVNNNERSGAAEILEGVLLAAQREHEQKKIKFEGNLLANIVFESSVDRASANSLLRAAQTLTYRQLCIMALFVQKEKFPLRNRGYRDVERFYDFSLFALLQEIYDLCSRQIVFIDGEAMASLFDINPAQMVIAGPAKKLYTLMGLEEIEQSDINALAEQLAK